MGYLQKFMGSMGNTAVVDPERAVIAAILIIAGGLLIFFARNRQGVGRLFGYGRK